MIDINAECVPSTAEYSIEPTFRRLNAAHKYVFDRQAFLYGMSLSDTSPDRNQAVSTRPS